MRGLALICLGRKEEAITSYDKALEVKLDYPEAGTAEARFSDGARFGPLSFPTPQQTEGTCH